MSASSERAVETARSRLRRVTAWLAGALLVLLTLVTVVDVIGRYLLNSPLPGAAEYTELLLMAVIFIGLPAVCLDDGHVVVDLFISRLKGRAIGFQVTVARLCTAGVLGLVSWELWKHGAQLGSYGEVTVYLRAPLAPFAKAASIITGACALITFAMAVGRVSKGSEGSI
jgi:TRAP-type C4-dicarboxylate transport system permease small subunit